jgi:hypothetical protein
MKTTLRLALSVLAALLLALPALAQSSGSSGGGTRGSGSAGTGGGASIASRGMASTAPSVSTATSSSRTYSSNSGSYISPAPLHVGSGGSGGSGYYVPNLRYSSFNSVNYYQWQDFYYFLQTRYYLSNDYFGRFYRNREPLLTPELLKLTVRQPLKLSLQMLNAVDELEMMVKERQAGKPVSGEAIAAKTQEIRDLAKQIRNDQSLSFIDQRRDKNTLKNAEAESLGLEAIAQLREMATDLNIQLRQMYTESRSSTVSVESLAAPSFGSLTKGIDRLTRTIENSARRM